MPNLLVCEAAPAHDLDFRRYASDRVAAFNKVQYDILKTKRPDLPVIHNFMGRYTEFDHYDVAETLDVASWDAYPLGHLAQSDEPEDVKRHYMRRGEPDYQAFHHDLYRAVGHGRMWIMEQQPGPVNWANFNPDPLPGMARLWAREAFAHGAEVVSYFRWRQAPFAQEQMHAGLLRPDSEPAPAYHEASQVAQELRQTGIAGTAAKGRVAIVFDYQSEWARQIQPRAKGFSHSAHVRAVYAAFRKHGVDIDILPPSTKSFAGYDIVAIPALFARNDALREAIADFEGHLLLGPRSGSKTQNFAIPLGLAPDLPSNLLDAKVLRIDSVDPTLEVEVRGGGGAVRHWRERIETRAEVEIEDAEGWPVLIARGKLHYLAASGNKALTQRIIDYLIAEADVPTLLLPAGVRSRVRDGFRIYVNYGSGAATLNPAADRIWLRAGHCRNAGCGRHRGATRQGRVILGTAVRISNRPAVSSQRSQCTPPVRSAAASIYCATAHVAGTLMRLITRSCSGQSSANAAALLITAIENSGVVATQAMLSHRASASPSSIPS
ncbi:beta-galactosidase [Devosia sp. A8/3-2]|nr:beta-galactosidase [Devosia sp. A8/3-2]